MNEYAPVSHIPNHSPTLEIGASIQSSPPVQFNLLDMLRSNSRLRVWTQRVGYLGALTSISGHIYR
jgi:hypothetical protein